METQLAPCPFCAYEGVTAHEGHEKIVFIACDQCGAITSFRAERQGLKSIQKYNQRFFRPKLKTDRH